MIVILLVVGLVIWRASRRKGEVARPTEVGPVGWTAGADWRVTRPLARAETRRLLRHPAFIVGVVITPLMLIAATSSETKWWRISPGIALALVPLGWMTIVATNLLALQPRRTGADELLAAAPAPQPVRTTGLLLSAVVATLVAVVLAAAWIAVASLGSNETTGSPRLAEVGAGLLIVAGSVAVGVGVARWLPHLGFGVLAVFAVSFLQARFMDVSTWPWDLPAAHPGRFLGFLAEVTSVDVPQLEVRPAGWHLVYLAGLVLLMAVVALARDGFPRRLGGVFAVAVVVIVGAGWMQTRPPSDARVAAMVDYLTNPVDHQTCTEVGPTSYCVFREQRERVDDWAARVEAIRALVPPEVAARELTVADRVPIIIGSSDCGAESFLDGLHPAVVDEVAPDAVWPDDGAVHPGTNRFPCGGKPVKELFTAMQVGSWAVGLPPSPHGLDVRCAGTGQARAVLALWLGAAVTPESEHALRDIADEHAGGMVTFDDWDDPPMLGVTFAAADVNLALALLDVPTERVAAAIADEWSTLTSPATASSAVVDVFDLESSGAALDRGSDECR